MRRPAFRNASANLSFSVFPSSVEHLHVGVDCGIFAFDFPLTVFVGVGATSTASSDGTLENRPVVPIWVVMTTNQTVNKGQCNVCVTIFGMYHNQLVSFAMVSIFHSLRIASEDVVVSFLKSNKALIGSRAIHGGPKRAHIAAVRPFHSKLPRPPTQSFNRGSETRKCSGHACSLYFQNELCSNLVGTQAFQPT